jgi:hypothetical protein
MPCRPVVAPQVTSRPPGPASGAFRPRGLPNVFYDDIHAPAVRQPLELQHHAPPDRHVGRLRPYHFAGDIAARDVRHRDADVGQAAPGPQIEMIERAGADPHQNVSGRKVRIRRLLIPEDIGRAMLMETNSDHETWRLGGLASW